jgi:hypothetical protein
LLTGGKLAETEPLIRLPYPVIARRACRSCCPYHCRNPVRPNDDQIRGVVEDHHRGVEGGTSVSDRCVLVLQPQFVILVV